MNALFFTREENIIDADYVLEGLKEVAEKCMQRIPSDGEGRPYPFNAAGANKALELLGKHLGMFTEKGDAGGNLEVCITRKVINAGD